MVSPVTDNTQLWSSWNDTFQPGGRDKMHTGLWEVVNICEEGVVRPPPFSFSVSDAYGGVFICFNSWRGSNRNNRADPCVILSVTLVWCTGALNSPHFFLVVWGNCGGIRRKMEKDMEILRKSDVPNYFKKENLSASNCIISFFTNL